MKNERRSNEDYLQEVWDSLESAWNKDKFDMTKGYDDEYECECITITLRGNEGIRAKIYVNDHDGQHPVGFEVVYRYPGDNGVGIGGYYEFQSTDMDGLGEEVFDYFDEIKDKVGESMKNEDLVKVGDFVNYDADADGKDVGASMVYAEVTAINDDGTYELQPHDTDVYNKISGVSPSSCEKFDSFAGMTDSDHYYMDGKINIYGGYHEIYLTDKELGKPYTFLGTIDSMDDMFQVDAYYDTVSLIDQSLEDQCKDYAWADSTEFVDLSDKVGESKKSSELSEGWTGGFTSRQEILDLMDGGIFTDDWKLEKKFGNWGCYTNQKTGRPIVLQLMIQPSRDGDWTYKAVTSDMGPADTNIQAAKWLKLRLDKWASEDPKNAESVTDYEWDWIEKSLGKEAYNKARKDAVKSLVAGDKVKLIDSVANGAVVEFVRMLTPSKMLVNYNGREMGCKTAFIDHKIGDTAEAKQNEDGDNADVYTIDLTRISSDGNEDGIDDMEAAQTFYSEEEAIQTAKDLADSYKDDEGVVQVVVMAGEYETPSGDIYGEPFDIFTASSSDSKTTAEYRGNAGYSKVDGLDYYAKDSASEALTTEGKNEVSNFSRNSLGVSFDGKFGNMRKSADWVIYPTKPEDEVFHIQCDNRWATIDKATGKMLLSAPHSFANSWVLMNDTRTGKAQRITLEPEVLKQLLDAIEDRHITDHSLDNIIRSTDVTDAELKGESKKSESLTLKQKELKDMARYGEAEDITTISDAEAKELKNKGIETVGISRGVYGMNGALLRDNEGNKYVITARSSNLFYFV